MANENGQEKREPVTDSHSVGNAAAIREALENIAGYAETARCHTEDAHVLGYLEQIEKWAKEALSAPARQCDVGTALEQALRFHDFCVGNSSGINGMCKPTCPCIDCFDKCQCLAKWAQMPYEAQEGGAS